MSQSCRAHLFCGARLIQQNSSFPFFGLIFFTSFLTVACEIDMKRYDRHKKHIEQLFTDFLNSLIYFNIVSCSSRNQVPYFTMDKGCDSLKIDTSAGGT